MHKGNALSNFIWVILTTVLLFIQQIQQFGEKKVWFGWERFERVLTGQRREWWHWWKNWCGGCWWFWQTAENWADNWRGRRSSYKSLNCSHALCSFVVKIFFNFLHRFRNCVRRRVDFKSEFQRLGEWRQELCDGRFVNFCHEIKHLVIGQSSAWNTWQGRHGKCW